MKNILGQRFGRLVALVSTDQRRHGSVVWQCRCDCGKPTLVPTFNLKTGNTKSCGCLQRETTSRCLIRDLSGRRFGRLIAITLTDRRRRGGVAWKCRCDCGAMSDVTSADLVSGGTRSCGCSARESKSLNGMANTKHGHARCRYGCTPEYQSWRAAKNRCLASFRPTPVSRIVLFATLGPSCSNRLAAHGTLHKSTKREVLVLAYRGNTFAIQTVLHLLNRLSSIKGV
jgi:hypothetical protein